ncbi:MAG: hypothetical protein ACFE9X_16380 [Promethearchaeota archaeon]
MDICKHHSIEFGVIFDNNRPSYNWNCSSHHSSDTPNIFRQISTPLFKINYRQTHSPFIYE